jgi:hypothetical protein
VKSSGQELVWDETRAILEILNILSDITQVKDQKVCFVLIILHLNDPRRFQ